MDLLSRVRHTIRQHDLARPATSVVAAVSGGSDSVALAHLLRELHDARELLVAGLAHFNHRLRDSAARDERFCEELAASFGWPILIDTEEVAARARRERRSLEDAARAARYEFFERARARFSADAVALGHTRDDQAETFLLRLVRGAGARGLAGMHPRRGAFIRPLIDCRRGDLRTYLAARDAAFVVDESNADVSIPRNRVRAELLPMLEERFNPSIVDTLADEAELAREEWRWLKETAEALAEKICSWDSLTCRLDANALAAAPLAVARMVVHRAMTRAGRGTAIPFSHVQAAIDLSRMAGSFDAPGQHVERAGGFVVLTSRPEGTVGRWTPAARTASLFRYPLSIPGEVALAETGCVVSVETAPTATGSDPHPAPVAAGAEFRTMARVRLDRLAGGLAVRNRRPGDRFRPAGLAGGKKLQDYFVDQKVAWNERDGVPIVVDDGDRIVWVAGFAIDDEFRVTDPSQGVLLLRLRQI
jgi:tRNA(Ile)-lysidine synthase